MAQVQPPAGAGYFFKPKFEFFDQLIIFGKFFKQIMFLTCLELFLDQILKKFVSFAQKFKFWFEKMICWDIFHFFSKKLFNPI